MAAACRWQRSFVRAPVRRRGSRSSRCRGRAVRASRRRLLRGLIVRGFRRGRGLRRGLVVAVGFGFGFLGLGLGFVGLGFGFGLLGLGLGFVGLGFVGLGFVGLLYGLLLFGLGLRVGLL